jgi:hypothetical protein
MSAIPDDQTRHADRTTAESGHTAEISRAIYEIFTNICMSDLYHAQACRDRGQQSSLPTARSIAKPGLGLKLGNLGSSRRL